MLMPVAQIVGLAIMTKIIIIATKTIMAAPAILLNHQSSLKLKRCLKDETTLVKIIHQQQAPVKIPKIIKNEW